jgi:cell division protein ZapA (FtsZ GTPase activity inhibitor)
MNTNNNIIKTPSRIVEKNISITNSNNNYPKKIAENPKEIDPLKCTPMDAINILYELKELSKK